MPSGAISPAVRHFVLGSCLASYFLSIVLVYQMSPFFQPYATECCNASPAVVGVIFSMLPFASFVASLLLADHLGRAGARASLTVGLLCLAGSSMGFGMSKSVGAFFFWRTMQGISSAAVYSSISTALAQAFRGQKEFAFANSLQEVCGGLGFSIGPALGAMLYNWGGFLAPFAVSAAGHVLLVFLTSFVWPRETREPTKCLLEHEEGAPPQEEEAVTLREILTRRQLWLAGAAAVALGGWGCVEPTLAVHFESLLGVTVGVQSGLLFGVPALFSVAASAGTPLLLERYGGVPLAVVGLVCLSAGSVILGLTDPTAGLVERHTTTWEMWALTYLGMIVVNVGYGMAWTPVLPLMMDLARKQVDDESRDPANAVAALFTAAACVGEAFGPIAGGNLGSCGGFSATALAAASLSILYALALLTQAKRLSAAELQTPPMTPLERMMSTPSQAHQRSAFAAMKLD